MAKLHRLKKDGFTDQKPATWQFPKLGTGVVYVGQETKRIPTVQQWGWDFPKLKTLFFRGLSQE